MTAEAQSPEAQSPAAQSPAARRPGRPSGASADATRAAVLLAARRQFAAHGYAATTNRTVARAAGLAHTAIYNHFGSKAQLFTAVFLDVQDRLVAELERSADATRAAGDGPLLPRVLLDSIEALRADDPSSVEFLASMYVEVRRHPELQAVFTGGEFPVVARLRALVADPSHGDDDLWFWVAFALGLAQLGALADAETFGATVASFRRRFGDDPAASPLATTGTGGPPR